YTTLFRSNEFVSSHSANRIRLADAGSEALGYLAEHGVSGLMAERIVYPLEVVEVDNNDSEIVVRAPCSFNGDFQSIAKQVACGKPGEMVGMRQVIEVFFGPLAPVQAV